MRSSAMLSWWPWACARRTRRTLSSARTITLMIHMTGRVMRMSGVSTYEAPIAIVSA